MCVTSDKNYLGHLSVPLKRKRDSTDPHKHTGLCGCTGVIFGGSLKITMKGFSF